jgi:hypothetical protein
MTQKKIALVAGVPGSDPTLPKVSITVGGKVYFLAFDFNSIAKAEELTGLNLLKSLDFTDLSITTYRALLFSALLKGNPDITLEEVGDMITVKNMTEVTLALVEAWTGSKPDVVEEVKPVVNPPIEPSENES